MRRRRTVSLLTGVALWLALLPGLRGGPQNRGHFYNVDREVNLSGFIREVIMEPRVEGAAPFLSVLIAEKDTGNLFMVEISPAWFFEADLHVGQSLRITGSLVEEGPVNTVMARRVQYRGELMTVRDKHGFPSWSGGRGGRMQRKRPPV